MRIFYFKWLILCFMAAQIGQLLALPVMNDVSYHYGRLYLEPVVGVLVGAMMGVALYLVMRDLIMSFWAWVGWTALAHGMGAFLGTFVMMKLGVYSPTGLITGLFVGVWVGIAQSFMVPLLDAKRWVLANIVGYGVGYVLAHTVGNLVMDLPTGMHVYIIGFMGLSVGGATLYAFLRSEFGELNGSC